ncbi:MAG: Bug family tripartite tricarboxylate transporter substrate binding protein [Lautropia sp.]
MTVRQTRRKSLATVLGALALGLAAGATATPAAAAWPERPIRIVVPFAAGGSTDVVARALAKELADALNQSVIVENKAGAGGNIGADAVAKAAPDGYTILMVSGSIVTVNPHMYAKMPFDAKKDLIGVTNVASGPQVLVVNKDIPAKDVKELIALVKADPKKFNFGSAGVGTQVHMAGESFVDAAGIAPTHVPYKGEGPAYPDIVGGAIQFMVGNIAAAAPFVSNGRLKALGVTSAKRSPLLPDVPTIAESGLPGFENTSWFGLMVPAGTPAPIIARIHEATVAVLGKPALKERLTAAGMEGVGNTPAEFAAAIEAESQRWAKVVKNRGLKAN